MNFTFLSESLHGTAEAAAAFFRNHHGVRQIQPEAEVEPGINYRPTLVGKTADHYIICIDVSDVGFSASLESFVLACTIRCLPIKCYIAVPVGIGDSLFRAIQRKAQEVGVGVVEVGEGDCLVVVQAMPLTFVGYRAPDPRQFPRKYRGTVTGAQDTLKSGDPVKACARIYDDIEATARALAREVHRRGLWRALHSGERRPSLDLANGAWARVMALLQGHLDFNRAMQLSPTLTPALLGKIQGLVPHRNDTGHVPSSKARRIRRDRELRTRFEHAFDTLEELARAVKPFRI